MSIESGLTQCAVILYWVKCVFFAAEKVRPLVLLIRNANRRRRRMEERHQLTGKGNDSSTFLKPGQSTLTSFTTLWASCDSSIGFFLLPPIILLILFIF